MVDTHFDRMLTLDPGNRVAVVEAGLRDLALAKVSGVLTLLGVGPDQSDARSRRGIAVGDAKFCAPSNAIQWRHVAVLVAHISDASFVNYRRTERGGKADGSAVGKIEIRSGTEA